MPDKKVPVHVLALIGRALENKRQKKTRAPKRATLAQRLKPRKEGK